MAYARPGAHCLYRDFGGLLALTYVLACVQAYNNDPVFGVEYDAAAAIDVARDSPAM